MTVLVFLKVGESIVPCSAVVVLWRPHLRTRWLDSRPPQPAKDAVTLEHRARTLPQCLAYVQDRSVAPIQAPATLGESEVTLLTFFFVTFPLLVLGFVCQMKIERVWFSFDQ